MIDWDATGSMLQGIGAITGSVAVLIAAVLGANTFKSWKAQNVAERRRVEAEKILTATYRVRRGLSAVRSPAMWGTETDAAQRQLEEKGEWQKIHNKDEQKRLATAQAYYNRINATRDDQTELEACQPMARALFGEPLEKAIEVLLHQFRKVQIYVDADYRDRAGADADFRLKIDSTIWEGYPSPEENEVDHIVTKNVSLIEGICLPALRLETRKS